MTRLTQPIVHFLSPDDPGIPGGPAIAGPLIFEEPIAALHRGRRYEDAAVRREPRWRGVIMDGGPCERAGYQAAPERGDQRVAHHKQCLPKSARFIERPLANAATLCADQR